jgi:hypothetical protein
MNKLIIFFNEIIKKNFFKPNIYSSYYELNDGQIGCFVSHLYLWQKIIENKLEHSIIYEDDIGKFIFT